MSLGRDVLARMAELLRVDELAQFSTLRPTHGFALRVGSSWQKVEVEVEVDDLDFADANVSRRLDRIVWALFDTARDLRTRTEAAQARAGRTLLQEFIRSARVVEPVPMGLPSSALFDRDSIRVVPDPTMPSGSFEIRSGTQVVRVINEEKPLDRFAAVVQEMEDL